MQRVQAEYNTQVMPAGGDSSFSPGYFQDGEPSVGAPGTVVPADWLNSVQEEILGVVEAAEITPERGNNGQLLEALRRLMVQSIYQVGDIYMSMVSDDPAKRFGGKWERISGRFLIGADEKSYKAGNAGGAATRSLTVDNMPAHSHTATMQSAGGHTHTRGTMNITGTVRCHANGSIAQNGATGAFYNPGGSGKNIDTGGGNSKGAGFNFDASRAWTGSTSSNGSHSHGLEISNSGGGKEFEILPPYFPVYIWRRVA